jgi:hypothetical protein
VFLSDEDFHLIVGAYSQAHSFCPFGVGNSQKFKLTLMGLRPWAILNRSFAAPVSPSGALGIPMPSPVTNHLSGSLAFPALPAFPIPQSQITNHLSRFLALTALSGVPSVTDSSYRR